MSIQKFSLELKTQKVEIDGSSYTISELTGRQRDKYLTQISKQVNQKDGGQTVTKFDGLQSGLVALALTRDGHDGPIKMTQDTIDCWPSAVVVALYDIAKDLSGIDNDEDKEGNG